MFFSLLSIFLLLCPKDEATYPSSVITVNGKSFLLFERLTVGFLLFFFILS